MMLVCQSGNGASRWQSGSSPGTTSAIEAGFPGKIRGTVTNTRGWETEPEPKKAYKSKI